MGIEGNPFGGHIEGENLRAISKLQRVYRHRGGMCYRGRGIKKLSKWYEIAKKECYDRCLGKSLRNMRYSLGTNVRVRNITIRKKVRLLFWTINKPLVTLAKTCLE